MWTKLKPPVNREWRHVLTQGFYIIGDAAARSGGAFGANCTDRARGRRFELLAVTGHIERGNFDTITPALLGVIKRMVGLRQQLGHVERPPHAVHEADADCTAYREAVDLLRHLGKGLANALGYGYGLLAAGVGEHSGKFLTTKPADEIGSTYRLAGRLGEDFQHAVADRMAEAVIDRLEVVEINNQERRRTRIGEVQLRQRGRVVQK